MYKVELYPSRQFEGALSYLLYGELMGSIIIKNKFCGFGDLLKKLPNLAIFGS
jgi:hypothetical protein